MNRAAGSGRRTGAPSVGIVEASLVAALREAASGDEASLRCWHGEGGRAGLHRAVLGASGLHHHDVEDVVQETVLAAWRAVRAGRRVEDDGAWLAGTAAGLCRRMRSAARRHAAWPPDNVADAAPSEMERRIRAEEARRALAAARAGILRVLPAPHGAAYVAHVLDGRSEREVAEWLHAWGGIGPDRAHAVLRDARAMWKHHLGGGDPRERWPRRYARKNRRYSTPPSMAVPIGVDGGTGRAGTMAMVVAFADNLTMTNRNNGGAVHVLTDPLPPSASRRAAWA